MKRKLLNPCNPCKLSDQLKWCGGEIPALGVVNGDDYIDVINKINDAIQNGGGGNAIPVGTPRDILTWDSNGVPVAEALTADHWGDFGNVAPTTGFWVATYDAEASTTEKLGFLELDFQNPTPNTVAFRTPGEGTIKVADAQDPQDAVSLSQMTTALNTVEPAFSKNTAFNKNFGTTAGTVAQGNDSRIVNGQTAFGWGNHASAGYLTTETDPTVPSHVKAITSANITTWNGKQNALVSGTSIKTIDSVTLLGSGNINTRQNLSLTDTTLTISNGNSVELPMKYGSITFTLGTDDVFEIPHGLGAIPSSFALTFSDGSNLEFIQSNRSVDATNITIVCTSTPTGVMTVYWQVFK